MSIASKTELQPVAVAAAATAAAPAPGARSRSIKPLLGLIPIVTGKRRRALHDAAAGSIVVYDWGDRPAELPAPVTAWLRQRQGPSHPEGTEAALLVAVPSAPDPDPDPEHVAAARVAAAPTTTEAATGTL